MDTIKLSIRLSQDVYDMLNALEKKQNGDNKKQHLPDTCKTDIIKNALREYYARHMDQSTENAYMALVTSTLDNLLSPYFNSLIEALKNLTRKTEQVDDSMQMESLMNRMCFAIIFRATNMPEDEDKIRRMLSKHTPFDDILLEMARDGKQYNSDTDNEDK